MLTPDNRSLLSDLLVPPPGYRLRNAVATTFTLSLRALTTLPLALSGRTSGTVVDHLRAISDMAPKLDVLCQAGMTTGPSQTSPIAELLAPSVHQITAPSGGLFHPKIWVLVYEADPGEGLVDPDSLRVRLLCGSRNLTHDRTWDATAAIDGVVGRRAQSMNRQLSVFLRAMPGRTAGGMAADRRMRLEATAELVERTEWERPHGVTNLEEDWLSIWVLGPTRPSGSRRIDMSGRRALIISPFLNEDGLDAMWPTEEAIVVSRAESLNGLYENHEFYNDRGTAQLFTLDQHAELPSPDDEDADRTTLNGLHAKVTVYEGGPKKCRVFIGSPNATSNAYNRNDEIVVEICGNRSSIGIDAVLGKDGDGLAKMLRPHTVTEPVEPSEHEELQRKVEAWMVAAGSIGLTLSVNGLADGNWRCSLASNDALPTPPPGSEVSLTPAGHIEGVVIPSWDEPIKLWYDVDSVAAISPFFRLRASAANGSVVVERTLIATIIGDPAGRMDEMRASILRSTADIFAFLSGTSQPVSASELGVVVTGSGAARGGATELPAGMLEQITMWLDADPQRLRSIDVAMRRACAREQQHELAAFWDTVTEAAALVEGLYPAAGNEAEVRA